MRNLDEAHENIFAEGRDAGVPHNRGQWDMPLRWASRSISPYSPDRATGYFHDITSTWFCGYAPDVLLLRWQQIKTDFDGMLMRCGLVNHAPAISTDLRLFGELGYATTRSEPQHRWGTTIRSDTAWGWTSTKALDSTICPTMTLCCCPAMLSQSSPGLYDPDEGWGLRIEDTIAFDADGKLINLSSFPYDPVIPVGESR